MKLVTSMGVFLLLFLANKAPVAASPSVYVVEGYYDFYAGIYGEKNDPLLHYKLIGQPDSYGHNCFLYREPAHPDTWSFGWGGDLSTVEPSYRAPARAGKPASTRWTLVGFESTLDFKVFEVKNTRHGGGNQQKISLIS